MEIGKEEPARYVEPIEDPFKREQPRPEREPVKTPEPEKVPAGSGVVNVPARLWPQVRRERDFR